MAVAMKKRLVLVGIRRKGENGFRIKTLANDQKGMTELTTVTERRRELNTVN